MNQITAIGSDIPKLRDCAIDACDMLTACGFTKPIATLVEDDICQLIKCVTLHSTIFQIKAELDQFMQGLNDAGVLEMLQNHAHLFQPFFVYSPQLLTAGLIIIRMNASSYANSHFAAQLVGLFENKVFSQQGSKEYSKEQATYMLFKDLLDEMEGMYYFGNCGGE